MLDFELTDLLMVFDELLDLTDEEQKIYWLKFIRPDNISITLCFSVHEKTATIIIRCNENIAASTLDIKNCAAINILDEPKKCLEIISGGGNSPKVRSFLSLLGESILETEVQ